MHEVKMKRRTFRHVKLYTQCIQWRMMWLHGQLSVTDLLCIAHFLCEFDSWVSCINIGNSVEHRGLILANKLNW